MNIKIEKKPSNPLDMRIRCTDTNTILGYIWGWKMYGSIWYRATVTHGGVVHGHDTTRLKDAIRHLYLKNLELKLLQV